MRQKVYDNISKPSYKTKDGNWLTEIQKYQMENQADFLKYVSLFYTMTDGFKDLSPLIKKQVKKERTSSIRELENKLKGSGMNHIKVEFYDERLTTVMAEKVLIEADMRRNKRKEIIDRQAAIIILQGYLDSLR